MGLGELSDRELMAHMTEACVSGYRLTAQIVAYLVEVEERRLDLRSACPNLIDFCIRRLKMSAGAASRRVQAAKLVRRFPSLLPRIASGELHLCALRLLRDHLNEDNIEELAAAASGLSEMELLKLLAARAPRPDVPETVTKIAEQAKLPIAAPTNTAPASQRSRTEPLSPERYRVEFTVSSETHTKLEHARDLMRHVNANGDLGVIVDSALDLLITKLEKRTYAKAARPKKSAPCGFGSRESATPRTESAPLAPGGTPAPADVPRPVRRAVFERDGAQCTFVDGEGNRCPARGFLELDHVAARARGGAHEAENLRVFCKPHNRYHAEHDFGVEFVAKKIANARAGENAKRAMYGLVNMGFAHKDVTPVVSAIIQERSPDTSLVEMLREALARLASASSNRTIRAR